ncbi:MAG: S-layer homology domain-containing protein, partial [Oscillospiraceae bacterium]|nr:S-layer homology domain-containing protein [Oscillospiraceae bacterium]
GNAIAGACRFSWDNGLQASDGTRTYESGALPVPAPGETKTFTFTNGGASATYEVTVYQGSEAVPPVFLEIDESQGTISAMNNDSDHETTCTGVLYADGKEYAMPKIKGRGNSSWMMARTKKPYNLTLDTKVNLLGIDSAKTKKWSLLANSNEPSLLRNKLGYDMAHAMGIGLDSAEADVWMNGKYLGTYLVTPKYDSFVPDDGFLIENDNYKEDPVEQGGDPSFDLDGLIGQGSGAQYYNYNRITVKKVGDNLLGEETVENLKAVSEKLRVYTQEVWDAIRSSDGYNAQGNYYADYVDMRSWAAMYLMQDYIKNYDFCGGSLFFHREGQADEDKLFAGPLWDLDIGFGCPENSPTLGRNLDLLDGTGWFVRNVSDTKTSMYKVIGKHADFMEEVSRVYNLYHSVFDNAPAHLEELARNMQASAEMNYVVTANESTPTVNITRQTTKQSGTKYEQVYVPTNSWRTYVDNVKTFATARSAFFHDNLYVEGAEEGFQAVFQLGSNAGVTVYDTQDLSGEGAHNPESVYARGSESGEIDVTGEGQINFKVELPSGYRVKAVTAEPAENYKNLKGPADTGAENVYRITKVTGPLTVKVEVEEIVCEHEFVDGVCIHCGAAAIQARFVCDEGVSIDVYKTQAADSEVIENAAVAFPRSSATGEVDISGEGQVNFVVKVADGYEFESITAEPKANYKNFKLPAETLVNNGYRITKMTGDVTVTVKAVKTGPGACEHDYVPKVTAPTCTAQGFTTYTCAKCSDSYVSDYTAKIEHDYKNGVCTVCGEQLLNVTISCGEGASVTVYKTQKPDSPHADNAASANPRNSDTGLIDCSGDGQVNFQVILADGYELESVTAEPTSAYKNLKGPADTGMENGYRITKVTGDFTITVTAKQTGPTPCEHEYKAVVTEPTCEGKGYTTYTCAKCGDTYVADEIPALGHNFKVEVVAPTCTDGGYTSHSCTRCRYGYSDNETPALGHDWGEGVVTTQPTETSTGVRTYTCSRCGQTRTEVIPELAHVHNYKAVVTEPTCTEKGFTTYTCAKCGDSYVADEVPALGHDFKVEVVAPTCTDSGYTSHACARCRYGYSDNETPALGHDWGEGVVTTQPTETSTGIRTYTCSRCGQTRTEVIPELAHVHNYKPVVTEPTCTEKGFTTYTCACGDSYVADEVPALGHDYKSNNPEPTCAHFVTVIYTCTRCGDTLPPEEVAPLPHDYQETVTEPTCTEEGYTTFTCTRCGYTYTGDKVPVLGHDYEAAVTAPTCTEKGFTTYTCSRCGDSYVSDETEPLEHDYKDGVCTRCGAKDPDYTEPPCGGGESCPSKAFQDVPGPSNWAHAGIDYCVKNKLMNGVGGDRFSPEGTVTRAQLVTILYRVAGSPETAFKGTFTDVADGQWYSLPIEWAAANGIVNGVGGGRFNPEGKITREQIAAILYRYAGSPEVAGDLSAFPDAASVSGYAVNALIWATQQKLINGIATGNVTNLAPGSNATRAQIAAIIMRYLES